MLYWMCKEAELTLTWHQIEHAVKRNFGGFEEFDPLETFRRKVIMPRTVDMSQHSKQVGMHCIVTTYNILCNTCAEEMELAVILLACHDAYHLVSLVYHYSWTYN